MLARKPLNRPIRPGCWLPLTTTLSAWALERAVVDVAGRLDHELEAARIAQAVDRAGSENVDPGLGDLALNRSRSRAMIASAPCAGSRRCRGTSSSITNAEPRLEPMALRTNERPGLPRVCATPGVSRAIVSILSHHLGRAAPARPSRAVGC